MRELRRHGLEFDLIRFSRYLPRGREKELESLFADYIRFDISADRWRAWIGNRATVVPGADSGVTENGRRRLATIAEYRKWAESMRRRGAKDGLYLYNLFGHPKTGEVWNQILTNGL